MENFIRLQLAHCLFNGSSSANNSSSSHSCNGAISGDPTFQRVRQSAMDTLVHLYIQLIQHYADQARSFAEHAGRIWINERDCRLALQSLPCRSHEESSLGAIGELQQFLKEQMDIRHLMQIFQQQQLKLKESIPAVPPPQTPRRPSVAQQEDDYAVFELKTEPKAESEKENERDMEEQEETKEATIPKPFYLPWLPLPPSKLHSSHDASSFNQPKVAVPQTALSSPPLFKRMQKPSSSSSFSTSKSNPFLIIHEQNPEAQKEIPELPLVPQAGLESFGSVGVKEGVLSNGSLEQEVLQLHSVRPPAQQSTLKNTSADMNITEAGYAGVERLLLTPLNANTPRGLFDGGCYSGFAIPVPTVQLPEIPKSYSWDEAQYEKRRAIVRAGLLAEPEGTAAAAPPSIKSSPSKDLALQQKTSEDSATVATAISVTVEVEDDANDSSRKKPRLLLSSRKGENRKEDESFTTTDKKVELSQETKTKPVGDSMELSSEPPTASEQSNGNNKPKSGLKIKFKLGSSTGSTH